MVEERAMKNFSEHMSSAEKLDWLDSLLAFRGLTLSTYHVGTVLARGYARMAATASETAENVATVTGLSVRTIMEALRRLRAAGFLGHFMRKSVVRPFVRAGRAVLSGASSVLRTVAHTWTHGCPAPAPFCPLRARLIQHLKSGAPGAAYVLDSTQTTFSDGVFQIRGTAFATSYLEAHMAGGALDRAARVLNTRIKIIRD